MKRFLGLSALVTFLAVFPAAHVLWAEADESTPDLSVGEAVKGHVPIGKEQVCHHGDDGKQVITVSASALGGHLGHGDFRLPACDFANVFFTGDQCSAISDVDGDGFADAGLNPRDGADGVTPGCPAGRY